MLYSRSCAAALGLLALVLAFPAQAQARRIYLNEVNIDTVRGQKFEDVDVEIDAQGNIRITAAKYQVHKSTPDGPGTIRWTQPDGHPTTIDSAASIAGTGPQASGQAAVVGAKYWLVTEENVPGAAQYHVDVFINGKFVKTIKSGDPQLVEDVTPYVAMGDNQVILRAVKNIGDARRSSSADHYLRIYIGKGSSGDNGAILMQNPVIDFRRTAAQMENGAEQKTFKAP